MFPSVFECFRVFPSVFECFLVVSSVFECFLVFSSVFEKNKHPISISYSKLTSSRDPSLEVI